MTYNRLLSGLVCQVLLLALAADKAIALDNVPVLFNAPVQNQVFVQNQVPRQETPIPAAVTAGLLDGDRPMLTETPRIGLNLGQWTSWGAEQLSRNVLKNPGFEGIVDRALVRVSEAHRHSFSDDETWLARSDGFWAGADFEVLTGTAVGQTGQILDSIASNARGRPGYRVTQPITGLAEGDIVALTLIRDDLPPARW